MAASFLVDLNEATDNALKDVCHIEQLPVEMLDLVVRYLPLSDQRNFRCLNSYMDSIVAISMEFYPYLDWSTVETCKLFFNETYTGKRYKKLRIGYLCITDWSWVQSSMLERVEKISFESQVTEEALGAIRHLLKNSGNLRKLDFKKYNFVKFQIGQLNDTGNLDEIFQQISDVRIKGNLTSNFLNPNQEFQEQLGPLLEFATFNCVDMTQFTSLTSFELLMMGGVTLQNISALPTSLKSLQLNTGQIPRVELNLMLDRLVNLERLIIQFCMLGNTLQLLLTTVGIDPSEEIPLDRNTYAKVLHESKIKYFHYFPISEINARQYVAGTSLEGSNIENLRTFARKDGFTLKIWRQEGFKRK